MRTARLVTVLVVDQTFTIVSRSHGRVRASSAKPPYTSTTVRPSTSTTSDSPQSAADAEAVLEDVPKWLEPGIELPVQKSAGHVAPLSDRH